MQAGDPLTQERLQAYTVAARSPGTSGARATGLLASAVHTQAHAQAYIDGFWLVAAIMAAALVLVALLRPAPPGPATAPSARRGTPAAGDAA